SFVALTIFVVVAWIGMRTVREEVADRRDYWAGAAKVGWSEDGLWNRPVVIWSDEGGYSLATNKFNFEGAKMTLGEFHEKLRELAENDLQGRWTSPGLAASYNQKSKQAQRVIFETGVLKPLNDAVARTLGSPASDAAQAGLPDALAMMIRLESDIQSRGRGDSVEMNGNTATTFLGTGSRFVSGADASDDSNLVSVMVWTYTSNKFGAGSWPPSWLSETVSTNGIVTNATLQAGLEHFIHVATNSLQNAGTNWAQVTQLQTALRTFGRAQDNFLAAIQAGDRENSRKAMDALKASRAGVDAVIATTSKNELFKDGISLIGARQAFTNQLTTYVSGAFEKVEKANAEGLRKQMDSPVFISIDRRLRSERNAFNASLASLVSAGDLDEFARFDGEFLAAQQGDGRAIDRRWAIFERAAALANATSPGASQIPALGFPVLRGSALVLTPGSIDPITAALLGLSDDLKPDSLQKLKIENTDFWKSLASRVEDLKQVALFLKGKDGNPPVCTVVLRKVDDPNDTSQRWRFRFRAIGVSTDGQKAAPIKIESDEDQELGKVTVTQPCALQLFQLADDKTPTQTDGGQTAWGPLALIVKYQGKPEHDGDFKTWLVNLPIVGADGNALNLRLVFDSPLPDPRHWPNE
ncbi:MAG TPA: hypothetical protein VK731_12185, partial [Candidatus Cybelea sp.]|nr:hypothetical protein [Candidatus Cybelea sp.]